VAKVEIGAYIAVVTNTGGYLASTCKALLHKLWRLTILKMPQYHHRCVLGPPQFVKLIMISSTQVQERLTGVEELAIDFFHIIIQYPYGPAESIKLFFIGFASLSPNRFLVRRILVHELIVRFSFGHIFFRDNKIFGLGIFAIQECDHKTLLHARNGVAELLHHWISAAVFVFHIGVNIS
jgi:hypothetical protein